MFWFSVSQSDDRKSYIQFGLWPGLTAKYACLNKLTKKERECDSKKVIIVKNTKFLELSRIQCSRRYNDNNNNNNNNNNDNNNSNNNNN